MKARLSIIAALCASTVVAYAQTPATPAPTPAVDLKQIPQDQLATMRTACDLVCTQVWDGSMRGQRVANQKWSCSGDNAAGCATVITEFTRRQTQAYEAASQAALSKMLKDSGLK